MLWWPQAAGKLSWKASTRLIMHYCDAPAHGQIEFHTEDIHDDYECDPGGA
jgi:hypothetical protein